MTKRTAEKNPIETVEGENERDVVHGVHTRTIE